MNYEYEQAFWWVGAALLALTTTHAILLIWVCTLRNRLKALRQDFYIFRDAVGQQFKADAIRQARAANDERAGHV
jgi:uncharacterized membrane protein YfbV (UPF0208 family)